MVTKIALYLLSRIVNDNGNLFKILLPKVKKKNAN